MFVKTDEPVEDLVSQKLSQANEITDPMLKMTMLISYGATLDTAKEEEEAVSEKFQPQKLSRNHKK